MNEPRKYGYIPPVIDHVKDYCFGGLRATPFDVLLESGDWRPFLPDGEPQRRGSLETQSCTNFGWLNAIETFLNVLFGDSRNFAERFLAIASGQTEAGNDPKNSAEAVRKVGLVEEFKLPFVDGMTWEQYLSPKPPTPEMLADAKKFREEYTFKWEYIFWTAFGDPDARSQHDLLLTALKRSPVPVGVFAWVKEGDRYVRPKGAAANHFCVLVAAEPKKCYWVYDSYSEDGVYLKKLDWDYAFDVAYGFSIRKNEAKDSAFLRILTNLKNILFEFLAIRDAEVSHEPAAPVTPPPAVQPPEWTRDRLITMCRRVAEEEGLSRVEQAEVLATIQAESNFNQFALNPAAGTYANGSRDFGLCQFNTSKVGTGWYVKLITPEQAVNAPEFAVRLMVRQWKSGRKNDWIAWRSGAYRKYISQYV